MTDHEPRLFASADAIRRVGEGLLDRSLPKPEWTHEAHLAATAWIVLERPDIDPERELRAIISTYNEATGVENTDHDGYHDTITLCFLAGIRQYLRYRPDGSIVDRINGLLASDVGRRDWPLRFYSRERLFSVAARRAFVTPDLAPLP